MPDPAGHRGVAEHDPRNSGPIGAFRPKPVTEEGTRALFSRLLPRASAADVEARVQRVMAQIAAGPIKPPSPLSQPLAEVADPYYGLGTHPDIIDVMWRLDASLPQSCRWVFWGGPALVHPDTGIVFVVGYGTIGFVMRLPPAVLAEASAEQAPVTVPGTGKQVFDISGAGPEWRFIRSEATGQKWCRAAYDFAGEPAP
ncbi:MAG: hypothetical protein HXX10_05075 [Rhodoplanes sp.]|uniref:hypothetical protein n=1 Tax=Rhodoplanes sp. TaxID=1968906 RepID=UPI00182A314C|nr:hypothetical protein [Rhodoplanes sp.]NVO13390.1 hypothetical protein [Rhodoplanes sp.]